MSLPFCTVTYRGKKEQYGLGTSFLAIAREKQENYKAEIVLAVFNNHIVELKEKLLHDGTVDFLMMTDKEGAHAYRRSLTFLLASCVHHLFPGWSVRVHFSIHNGYYCEFFENGKTCKFSNEQLEALEKEMRETVKLDLPIERNEFDIETARSTMKEWGLDDKLKMLKFWKTDTVTMYSLSDYYDYYYGPLVPSSGYLKEFRLKRYHSGFMLVFPEKAQKKAYAFEKSDKLFQTFEESFQWSEFMELSTIGDLNEVIANGKIQSVILVHEALMEGKIASLASRIAEQKKIKFVLIAGPSSSGKTTFSRRLAIQLRAQGMRPHPISMDDFYLDRADTPRDENGEMDFEAVEALDIDFFNKCMEDLLAGETVQMPTFNFKTGMREFNGRSLTLGPNDVLVIEGIHGLNDRFSANIPKPVKFKIYISALTQLNMDYHSYLSTADCRLIRRLVRDARTRNISAVETLRRWPSVRRGEEKLIFPYQEKADVMFNSALDYEMAVLKVYAEPLLCGIGEECPEFAEARRLLKLLDYFLPVPNDNISHNSILREFIGGSCFNV